MRRDMYYKKLEENVMRHLDSMTGEELQADFDRHVERVDRWAKENPEAAEALGYDVPEEPTFKCFYLRDGKLSWSDHDANIKTMVKFIKNNESWMTEQFYDCLCYGVRSLNFAQQWKNEFQEMPWFYYDMEHLVGVRDIIYEFYSAVKYDINERLKDSLIDAIACIEWFGKNLKNSPRNWQYKDFHEYDDSVLKRNPKHIQYLHCKFLRQAKQEEERLIRKAEENRKTVNPSDALLKPVSPASECQRKILYCEEEKENMKDKKDINLWETDYWKKKKPILHKMWEERRKRGELDEPEPTALACSDFPTREEIDELDRIGLAGVMKKRERQERWDAIWFWVKVSFSSICGGVVGTVLYRWILR